MTYTLKDVDDAEALVLAERPGTLTYRDDYDWGLVIRADENSTHAIILFQCGDQYRPEIKSTPEEIRNICYWIGSQWTPEQIEKIKLTRGR